MPITVRQEQPADVQAIGEVTIAAFSGCPLGYHGEAEIIDRLRAGCRDRVSLIAEKNGRLVGHVLFSPVQIIGPQGTAEGMGLAPMSVLPEFQNEGIGSLLVRAGLKRLEERGCAFVVVLGHPEFYARFGFEPAREFGITCEFEGIPDEVFRIKLLSILPANLPQGTARYREEFSQS